MPAVRLRVLDTAVRLRCAAEEADRLRQLYAPFLSDYRTEGSDTTAGGGVVEHELRWEPLPALCARINALALAEARCLAVHAGAIAAGSTVVAFPAASGAGKSTLTAACLQAGLDLVSDEALCLGWDDGAVRPYPRPLALSAWSAAALGLPAPTAADELLVTAGELGARVASPPLHLSHVVLLESAGGSSSLSPAPRSAGAAELLRRSFTHWHRPERAFELVHEIVRDAQVWWLRRAEPAANAATIAALLRGCSPGELGP